MSHERYGAREIGGQTRVNGAVPLARRGAYLSLSGRLVQFPRGRSVRLHPHLSVQGAVHIYRPQKLGIFGPPPPLSLSANDQLFNQPLSPQCGRHM